MRYAIAFVVAVSSCTGCIAVEGEHVRGADLALGDARFAAVPADYAAGFAPLPGLQRVFRVRELLRIVRANGIEIAGLQPLCFERAAQPLTETRIREALTSALAPGTRLEILDFSRLPVPNGTLQFVLSDLPRPPESSPEAAVTWRGRIRYGSGGSAVIWAKVRVLREAVWVEAAEDIPAHQLIEPGQVRVRTAWRSPRAEPVISEAERVVGHVTVRTIRKSQVFTAGLLAADRDVRSGDTVDVVVVSGGVDLRLTGTALSGGRTEGSVLVALDSGKKVQARVIGKAKVSINADSKNQERSREAGAAGVYRRRGGDDVRGESEEAGAALHSAGSLSR